MSDPVFSTTVTAATDVNPGTTLEQALTPSIACYTQITSIIFEKLRAVGVGKVTKFDATKQTVSVQLVTKELVRTNSGDPNNPSSPVNMQAKQQQLTELVNIPIMMIGGGIWAITMPIQVGDECLVLFSDVEIDAWYQNGGINNVSISERRHSLADGIAICGLRNQTRPITNYVTDAVQIRNEHSSVVIELASNTVTVTAPNLVINTSSDVTANVQGNLSATIHGSLQANVDGHATIDATGTASLIGEDVVVTAHGDLTATVDNDATLSVQGNANASVNGNFNIVANGDGKVQGNNMEVLAATKVTINGHTEIDGHAFLTHTHTGVTTGAGTSGPVTP